MPFSACDAGLYGQFCNLTCMGGEDCGNGTCDRDTGNCFSCVPYKWGNVCDLECPNCVDGFCFQDSGVCPRGCNNGFYWSTCDMHCQDRCTICDQFSGSCTLCEVGTFGPSCEYNCSLNCRPNNDREILCSKDNGFCSTATCKSGFYGRSCEQACSNNCAANGLGLVECDIDTGYCSNNCTVGYYGSFCDGYCSINCLNQNCFNAYNHCIEGCVDQFYGLNTCHVPCSNSCIDGICFDMHGECQKGCKDGFYGAQCQFECRETCLNGSCDRINGTCSECGEKSPGPQCRTAGNLMSLQATN